MDRFKREERYIVIKIEDLHEEDFDNLMVHINSQCLPLIERCVVVESDWPEYEGVWKSIEERCK